MASLLDLLPPNVGTKLILPALGLLLVSAVCVLAGYSLNGDLHSLHERPAHLSQLLAFLLLLIPLYFARYFLLALQNASGAKDPVDRLLLQGAVWTLIVLPAALAGISAVFTVAAYQPAAFAFLASELRSLTPTDSLLARLPDVSAHAHRALLEILGRVALGAGPAYVLYIYLATRVASNAAASLRWRALLPALCATAIPFAFGWSVVGDAPPLWTTAGLLVILTLLAAVVPKASDLAMISVTTVLALIVAVPFLRLSSVPRFTDALEIALTSFVVACGMLVTELWLLTQRREVGPTAANIATALLPCGLLIALLPRVTPDVFVFAPVLIIALSLLWHLWLQSATSGKTTTIACIGSGILVPVTVGYFTGSGLVDPLVAFLGSAPSVFPLTAGAGFVVFGLAYIHYSDRSDPGAMMALISGRHGRFNRSADSHLLASQCSALVTALAGILLVVANAGTIVRGWEGSSILKYAIPRAGLMGVAALVLVVLFRTMASLGMGGELGSPARENPGLPSIETKPSGDA